MPSKTTRFLLAVFACLVAGLACYSQAEDPKPAAWPVGGVSAQTSRPASASGAATAAVSRPASARAGLYDDDSSPAPVQVFRLVVTTQRARVPVVASQPATASIVRPAETLPDTTRPASAPAIARPDVPPSKPLVEIPDDLVAALREKAEVPITKPRDFKEPPSPLVLPRDGTMLVDHRARLVNMGGGWRALVFEKSPSRPQEASRYVLPSQLLDQMEQELARDPNALFRVSGENTTYKMVSYIMLTKAILEPPPRPAPLSQPAQPPASQPVDVTPVTVAPASSPASQAASSPASSPASKPVVNPTTPDDILAKMLDERPGTPMIIAAQRRLNAHAPASGSPVPTGDPNAVRTLPTPQEKWLVIDRLARIIKDENSPWLQVHFESDNTLDDEPLRLLPATILEKAERNNLTGVKVRVSGIIAQYQGRQYLLLRKVTLERQMGQF